MLCPYCRHDTRVLASRQNDGLVRRRRECPKCDQRFTTHERITGVSLVVVQRDGRREPFDREKLLNGLRLACTKRPVATADLEAAAEQIEAGLFAHGQVEVPALQIGDAALQVLRGLDDVAYVRFASVYQTDSDVSTLRRALDGLALSGQPA